jgi:hypothetical protein
VMALRMEMCRWVERGARCPGGFLHDQSSPTTSGYAECWTRRKLCQASANNTLTPKIYRHFYHHIPRTRCSQSKAHEASHQNKLQISTLLARTREHSERGIGSISMEP